MIEAVLPRRSAFTRKEAGRQTVVQVVAANVDTVFLVTAFGGDLNPRRLERYLTSAWDSGSTPVVVANKVDLADDPAFELAEVESVALGVPVIALSAETGDGLDGLEPYLEPGRTIALLGSSGVGKSTLVNRLAGRELLVTPRSARTAAAGTRRRTASSCRFPRAALLIDTPGMRELQLWADEEVLDSTFTEIAELAGDCRFGDCSTSTSPGVRSRRRSRTGRFPPSGSRATGSCSGSCGRSRSARTRACSPRHARRGDVTAGGCARVRIPDDLDRRPLSLCSSDSAVDGRTGEAGTASRSASQASASGDDHASRCSCPVSRPVASTGSSRPGTRSCTG